MPEQSFAIQAHGAPEGLYVHQMAHLLFSAALGYLFWDTKRSGFSGRGWTYLRIFCVLTILWNLLAIVGHAAAEILHSESYTNGGEYLYRAVQFPLTFVELIYYIAQLEHLVMVPGMIFLVLSLRYFYKDSMKAEK